MKFCWIKEKVIEDTFTDTYNNLYIYDLTKYHLKYFQIFIQCISIFIEYFEIFIQHVYIHRIFPNTYLIYISINTEKCPLEFYILFCHFIKLPVSHAPFSKTPLFSSFRMARSSPFERYNWKMKAGLKRNENAGDIILRNGKNQRSYWPRARDGVGLTHGCTRYLCNVRCTLLPLGFHFIDGLLRFMLTRRTDAAPRSLSSSKTNPFPSNHNILAFRTPRIIWYFVIVAEEKFLCKISISDNVRL